MERETPAPAPTALPPIAEWRVTMILRANGLTTELTAYGPDGQRLEATDLPRLFLDDAKTKAALAAHDLSRALSDYPDP